MVLRKLNTILNSAEEVFIAIAILSLAVGLFGNVVGRYGFGVSSQWIEEFTRYAIVWLVFVGGSVCVREKTHVRVETLVLKLVVNRRWIIILAIQIIGVAFSLLLTVYGVELVADAISSGQKTPTAMMRMYVPYLAIPIGGVLMTARYLQVAFDVLRKRS